MDDLLIRVYPKNQENEAKAFAQMLIDRKLFAKSRVKVEDPCPLEF